LPHTYADILLPLKHWVPWYLKTFYWLWCQLLAPSLLPGCRYWNCHLVTTVIIITAFIVHLLHTSQSSTHNWCRN